ELQRLGHEEVGAADREGPPQHDEHEGQSDEVQRALHGAHTITSPRTELCHRRARFSTRRMPRLMITPMMPVASTSAYIGTMLPPDWLSALCVPSPGVPITSSAVMASTRATAAPRRRPVMRYGSVVGHTTWRTRAHQPRP